MRRLVLALVLVGGVTSFGCSGDDSSIREVSQRAELEGTPYPTYSMVLTTPPGVPLQDVAMAATDQLMVRDGVNVGSVGSEVFIGSSGLRVWS